MTHLSMTSIQDHYVVDVVSIYHYDVKVKVTHILSRLSVWIYNLIRLLTIVATFILPIENQKIMLKDTNRVGGIGRLEIATSFILRNDLIIMTSF